MEQGKNSGRGVVPDNFSAFSDALSCEALGRQMKKIRAEEGISAQELARRMGVSRSTVLRYEAGKVRIEKPYILAGIAAALGVSPARLMQTDETPSVSGRILPEAERLIRTVNTVNLTGAEQETLLAAVEYTLTLFRGIAGNWAENDGEKADEKLLALKKLAEHLPDLRARGADGIRSLRRSDGKGSLRNRGGRWYCRYYFSDRNGRRIQREFAGGKTRAEAETNLRKAVYEYENGLDPSGARMTVNDLLNAFLRQKRSGSLSIGTLMLYETASGRIRSSLGHRPIRGITHEDLQTFLDQQSALLSAGYLRVCRAVLTGAFSFAVYPGKLLAEDPSGGLILPKKRRPLIEKPKSFPPETLDRIERALPPGVKEAFSIARYTGMRLGEVCGLGWEDVDLEKRVIRVRRSVRYNSLTRRYEADLPKSGRERVIPVGEKLAEVLSGIERGRELGIMTKKEGGRTHYLLLPEKEAESAPFSPVCRREGGFLHPQYAERAVRRAGEAAGVAFHFHLLRHSFATALLSLGAPPQDVQALLGHARLSTTMDVYAHTTAAALRNAASLLDGDKGEAEGILPQNAPGRAGLSTIPG